MRIFVFKMPISSPNSMFDHLLELSYQDSNKWSIIVFGEEITQIELIEVNFTQLIRCYNTHMPILIMAYNIN